AASCNGQHRMLSTLKGEVKTYAEVLENGHENHTHKIAVYASPWSSPSTPQHSLPGRSYPLPGLDFHQLDNVSLS
ncbi:MAG: hypothetical protein QM636_17865, partial [Rhizobium sp.]